MASPLCALCSTWLRLTYAGKMGVQYMHIDSVAERQWLQQRMEPAANQWSVDPAAKKRALQSIVLAAGFETFLDNRFKDRINAFRSKAAKP